MVGRYRLESLIGKGGMAEVFLAVDTQLGRAVAVKTILPSLVSQRTFLERFLREARLVAALEHPNILPIYDFGEQDGVPYLVMPQMTGGTLAERVGLSGLPPELAVDYVAQLAHALDVAHGAGILHRDVKPSNVLMDRNERPVLADFGLARVAGAASDLTATGIMVGTPLYMAPELAQGAEASPSTDLYALAVLAYQMLSGTTPFSGETPVAVLHQHVARQVPPLSERDTEFPPRVDDFFKRALAKQADRRFESGTELAHALGRSLSVRVRSEPSMSASDASAVLAKHPTDAAIDGSLTVTPPPAAKPPLQNQGAPRAGLGAPWITVFVALFAVLGVLLGARSLLGRDRAATEPAPAAVETAGDPAPAPIPETPPPIETTRTQLDTSTRKGFQQPRRPRPLSVDDFESLSSRAAAGLETRPDDPTLGALHAFAEGGLAYTRGDDDEAREALDRARTGLKDSKGVRGLPVWTANDRPAAELTEWELAASYGDARGTGLSQVDAHLASSPEDLRARMGRALLLHLNSRHDEAIEEASSVRYRVPGGNVEVTSQVVRFIADEYAELGQWSDAVSAYLHVARLGGSAAAQAGMEGGGIAIEKLNDRERASELFQAACDAGNALACRRVGALRAGRGRRGR
jgi:serine/threonine-protein kinase